MRLRRWRKRQRNIMHPSRRMRPPIWTSLGRILQEYYTHYALAQKLYHSLTNGVNEEVSDDEDARDGNHADLCHGRRPGARGGAEAGAGDDFASVANNYNELSAIQVTVSRDDLPDEVEGGGVSAGRQCCLRNDRCRKWILFYQVPE